MMCNDIRIDKTYINRFSFRFGLNLINSLLNELSTETLTQRSAAVGSFPGQVDSACDKEESPDMSVSSVRCDKESWSRSTRCKRDCDLVLNMHQQHVLWAT